MTDIEIIKALQAIQNEIAEDNEDGFEHEAVEEIQNTINIISELKRK